MSIDTQALIAKIKKQTESFDTVVLKEDEANALVEAMEAAEARIAELETREVVLPPLVDASNVPFAAHTWNCYRTEAVKALRAAGISVKGE
ncbi:hypothetical protein E0D81_08985 [Lelliottia amnigena]|uniref:hypothetical protein n=1 Tax=Lelliottia amnigena TaxID=61646 RepID=UPI0010401FDF|nr:hypothetical protein [Lelliottia amnigena]TCD20937.1 hypothetical protein E0D81_08985 [Lelliottia amnigena]